MHLHRAVRPPAPRGPGEVAGIDIDWVLETPLVRLSRWRCRESAAGITGERQQLWRVIGFVHEGAYGLKTPRGGGLIDSMQVALFNPFEPYSTSHPCGPGDHGSGLVLREELFGEILARHQPRAAEDSGCLPPSGPCPTGALDRHRRLLRAAASPGGTDPLAAEETAIAVADEILGAAASSRRRDDAPGTPAMHRDLAERVRMVLGREFRRPLHLAAIAAAVGATPAHLCRVFRKATGESIHRYLTRLRLRASLEPLLAGAEDLSGLAFDLGFSSHSHFTAAFRREFGCPPSRLRDATPRATALSDLRARI
jgi:AraC-like DNA-binding protein